MVQFSKISRLPLTLSSGYRYLMQKKKHLGLLLLLPLFFVVSSFNEPNTDKPAGVKKNAGTYRTFDGGDFSLDFVASDPFTYVHNDGMGGGGGAYDDRTKGEDVVESLQGGDFTCGDIVTYLTRIKVAGDASGSQTIELDYSFLANTTGQSGAAHSDIVGVSINYGAVSGGDGPGGTDAGMNDDGGSTATLSNESLNGDLYAAGSTLTGTVTVNDLEAGETVIVRIDVRISCQPESSPTGNLAGAILEASVTSPEVDPINVGNQTVPFQKIGDLIFPDCSITPRDPVCSETTTSHTATSDVAEATFEWTISGNATFTGGGLTFSQTPAGTTSEVGVDVGSAGSYTLSVSISKQGYETNSCSQIITVNETPVLVIVNPDAVCEPNTVDLTAAAVTAGSTLPAGTTLKYYESDGTTEVADPTAVGEGTYYIEASSNTTPACSDKKAVTVTVNDNPASQTLTGGSFCTSDANGVEVTTTSSESGVDYQLYDANDDPVGSTVPGDGNGLSFGVRPVGTYHVIATNATTACATTFGNAAVTQKDQSDAPTVSDVDYCKDATAATLTATGTNLKWYDKDGNLLGEAPTPSTATVGSVDYYVTQTEAGECESEKAKITVTVNPNPVLVVKSITNACPALTANLTTAVDNANSTLPTGTTFKYYLSDGTTEVSNPSAVAAPGTYYIEAITTATPACKDKELVTVIATTCYDGCTPGYWKNRKASWNSVTYVKNGVTITNNVRGCVIGASSAVTTPIVPIVWPTQLSNFKFREVFGLTADQVKQRLGTKYGDMTLLTALGLGDGSGYTQLARAGTAALLNSCAINTYYPFTSNSIVSSVKAAFTSTISNTSRAAALQLATTYDRRNNSTCVLDNSGSRATTVTMATTQSLEADDVKALTVATYPNPYRNNVRFVVTNPKAGQGSLEVYNMLGQRVETVHRGFIPEGTQSYELNLTPLQRTSLIYQLRVGSTQVTGKLLHAKD